MKQNSRYLLESVSIKNLLNMKMKYDIFSPNFSLKKKIKKKEEILKELERSYMAWSYMAFFYHLPLTECLMTVTYIYLLTKAMICASPRKFPVKTSNMIWTCV